MIAKTKTKTKKMTIARALPKFSLLTAIAVLLLLLPQAADAKKGFKRARIEPTGIIKVNHTKYKVPKKDPKIELAEEEPEVTPEPKSEPQEEKVSCHYQSPEKPVYSSEVYAYWKTEEPNPGGLFEMNIYLKNTGNVPWFSSNSGCKSSVVNLGTDFQRDRKSLFYTNDLMWKTHWMAPNRVAMNSNRVNPGEVAEFKFWNRAPDRNGLFREYFTPVAEGVTWMDDGRIKTDVRVGAPDLSGVNTEYLAYIKESTDLSKLNLSGDKSIEVDISDQTMKLKIGEHVIREHPVSSGKPSTPTPFGTTHIFQKQEVRVSYAWPHYIMPKWLHFRAGGYGIHALPSLGNDGGVFWTEALNHIGERRSHGCIRLLPEDADFTYEFATIGTRVDVVP